MSKSVGELIGLDGIAVTTNSYFAITNLQCGEIKIENVVGSQSALTPSQEGIYTCRIPLQSGEIKEIDFGIYRNEFNSEFLTLHPNYVYSGTPLKGHP